MLGVLHLCRAAAAVGKRDLQRCKVRFLVASPDSTQVSGRDPARKLATAALPSGFSAERGAPARLQGARRARFLNGIEARRPQRQRWEAASRIRPLHAPVVRSLHPVTIVPAPPHGGAEETQP